MSGQGGTILDLRGRSRSPWEQVMVHSGVLESHFMIWFVLKFGMSTCFKNCLRTSLTTGLRSGWAASGQCGIASLWTTTHTDWFWAMGDEMTKTTTTTTRQTRKTTSRRRFKALSNYRTREVQCYRFLCFSFLFVFYIV